ncbi:hypothetical protein HYQ46_007361, partial [Verticillium longisporum]
MFIGTRKPPTHIHKPLAKAVMARDTTKIGKMLETRTTRDSAARRSRKSHMTKVMKAEPSERIPTSQYATTENRIPHRAHHDREAKVHDDAYAIGNNIAICLDPGTLQKGQRDH